VSGCCAPFGGEAGSPSNTVAWDEAHTSVPIGILIHLAVWPQQTWVENWGWGCVPFGGAGSPFNTMWPGLRPIAIPSGILIHPTIWPQYTNVTDRQDDRQTDNGPIA